MIIHNITTDRKREFNKLATHPLQSWEWGEFRKTSGVTVIRLGKYEKDKLTETAQITIHKIPFTSWTIGYLPKGGKPSREMLSELIKIGKQHHCIFIKLEPNIAKNNWKLEIVPLQRDSVCDGRHWKFDFVPSPHPLFTKYTWELDLTKSEDQLLANMHPKTRYNIRVAQKHNIVIKEENSSEAFNKYLELTFETTKRQKFYAHNPSYHRLMWETLKKSSVAHLFTANYDNQGQNITLASWIVFLFNDVLYYPYGASSSQFRNLMASNLLMWEIIRWGIKNGAKKFDMWGAIGPNPSPKDAWFGFNRFKEGYGASLVEYAGSFDLIIHPKLYRIYNMSYQIRQIILKIIRMLI